MVLIKSKVCHNAICTYFYKASYICKFSFSILFVFILRFNDLQESSVKYPVWNSLALGLREGISLKTNSVTVVCLGTLSRPGYIVNTRK